MRDNRCIDSAKSLLWHYFNLLAKKTGTPLDSDCRTEIEGIVEDIADGIMMEIREELKGNA